MASQTSRTPGQTARQEPQASPPTLQPTVPQPRQAPARDLSRGIARDITIEHGPRELLARFFVEAENAARDRGVYLTLGTLDELLEVNRANRDTWRPLISIFDKTCGAPADRTVVLLGRNRVGDVVATQCARLYDWRHTSFYEEATSLRLYYADPAAQRRPNESTVVTAPSARSIRGQVVYTGGAWYRPDYRRRWLSGILPRIARALAFTHWQSDYTMTIMAERIVQGGTSERTGHGRLEWEVFLNNNAMGDLRMALLFTDTEEMLADLRAFPALAAAQVDAVVHHRTA